jgi:hypothetical protein
MMAAALALLALAAPRMAAAQGTSEQVAQQYLATLKAQDWAANAALVHPAEQDSLKAALLDAVGTDTATAGLRQLFNVASAAELRALPSQTVYQRFVAGTLGQQEGLAQMLSSATFTVLGHVDAGDTSYVVYRVAATVNGNPLSQVTVLSVRRSGAAWKVRLPEELKQAMVGMRMAAAQRRAAASAAAATPPPAAPSSAPTRPAAPPTAPARP